MALPKLVAPILAQKWRKDIVCAVNRDMVFLTHFLEPRIMGLPISEVHAIIDQELGL